MSAVISPCGLFRYRLDRRVQDKGPVFAYFGVNGSTADADEDDHTVRKWTGFTRINGGRRFIVGNPFAYRATDVRKLAKVNDPIGPGNSSYLAEIIAEADILVPCWGNRTKVPRSLRFEFDRLERRIRESGKPVRIFGLTKSGDPMHPLMLGYETPLIDWLQTGRFA